MRGLMKVAVLFVLCIVIFGLQRLVFLCLNAAALGSHGLADYMRAFTAGVSLDASIAGYVCSVPLLMSIASQWCQSRIIRYVECSWLSICAFLISAITILDAVLYGYWGFRLDATPIFYFATSPTSAMASATTAQLIVCPLVILALTAGIGYGLCRITALKSLNSAPATHRQRIIATIAHILAIGALFIVIRGGVTVSTMNLSRAYFSQDRGLNHLAVNPQFSLLYSLTHQGEFASQFHFMDDDEAQRLFAEMHSADFSPLDSLLNVDNPDIYIIIAESFSAHLMPTLGGEPIAMRMDSLAAEGLLFTRFYANGFRTDRAIPAILSGFPSQPTTSVMKYVEKAENLPSLPSALSTRGYDASYYYGGDINFTNMSAYLVSAGFGSIVCDADFPIGLRLSKWGVHDHLLMQRALTDIAAEDDSRPHLRVIQTSSSHEPFDVPYSNSRLRVTEKDWSRANAFAYTDSCIGDFVARLKASPRWERSLVVIVPDHYGVYPPLDDLAERHHVPLIIVGGALACPARHIDTIGSQIDIAATVLAMLGLPAEQFTFSKNLFDPEAQHFAYFTGQGYMGMADDSGTLIYDLETDKAQGTDDDSLIRRAQAYLQTIYQSLSDL